MTKRDRTRRGSTPSCSLAHALGVHASRALHAARPPARPAGARRRPRARRVGAAAREPLQYVLGEWGFRRLTLDRRPPRARSRVPRPRSSSSAASRSLAGPSKRRASSTSAPGSRRDRARDRRRASGARRSPAIDVSRGGARARARERRAAPGSPLELRRVTTCSRASATGRGSSSSRTRRTSTPTSSSALAAGGARLGAGRRRSSAVRPPTPWRGAPPTALADGGALVLEVGDGQADDGLAVLLRSLGYTDVGDTPDLAGRDRVVEGAPGERRSTPAIAALARGRACRDPDRHRLRARGRRPQRGRRAGRSTPRRGGTRSSPTALALRLQSTPSRHVPELPRRAGDRPGASARDR